VPVAAHRLSVEHTDQSGNFGDPIHPTAFGNQMMAEDVGRFLLENVME